MNWKRFQRSAIRTTMAAALCGTTFQLTSCVGSLVREFNPCGTILTCDPLEYDLLFTDVPDFDFNPTCTVPGVICTGTNTGTNTGTGGGGTGGGGFGGGGFGGGGFGF